jgi:mannitol/fructose-specific phosphotransferase system IIA component (Ntr-type)
MNLWHSLHSECIATHVPCSSKNELLQIIARSAAQAPELASIGEAALLKALTVREELGSTGLTDSIAIPHCSFEGMQDFVVGVVTTQEPIEFHAIDEKPSQVFIFLIGPTGNRNKHIRLLSSISKAIKEPSLRKQLKEASSAEQIKTLFESRIEYSDPGFTGQGKSLVTVYIQHEEYFNDILEALSSDADGSVSVIETENANQYLYHMPLFAGFWSDHRQSFSRIIVSVVNRESVNSVLRRVHTIAPDMEQHRGVMITVQDLAFSLGSIDF